jgi:hypothetical protein
MSHRRLARALLAGAFTGLGAVLAVALVWLSLSRGVSQAREDAPGPHVSGRVVLRVPGGGRVLVDLPAGWSTTRIAPGTMALASARTCHTATLTAFVDRAAESPSLRAVHLLGYVAGREFDGGRLWEGTTAGGRGYAVYDQRLLAGAEVVRTARGTIAIVLHGLPAHGRRCSGEAAAATKRELSRLLQDLRVPGLPRLRLRAMPHTTA